MSRYFSPISIEELKKKIESYAHEEDGHIDYRHITTTVSKDLDKVSFSTENMTDEGYKFGVGSMVGYHTLSNGMTYFGMCCGGDWEVPLFILIYSDGQKLRGYIPKDGNLWNTTTKEAYGNDNEADYKDVKKRWPDFDWGELEDFESDMIDEYEPQEIEKDIMSRIVKTDSKKKVNKLEKFTNEELKAELKRRDVHKNKS